MDIFTFLVKAVIKAFEVIMVRGAVVCTGLIFFNPPRRGPSETSYALRCSIAVLLPKRVTSCSS